MYRFLLPLILVLSPLTAMTRMDYNSILVGTPITQVIKKVGEPYSVRDLGERTLIYEYIERFTMNNELIYDNHYLLTVVNGQVVDKMQYRVTQPPFDQLYEQDPNYNTYP